MVSEECSDDMLFEHVRALEQDRDGWQQQASLYKDRIAELQSYVTELEQRLQYDSLTGLRNGALFDGFLQQACEQTRRSAINNGADHPLSVGFVDLVNLKGVNDEYGHAKGDAALQTVANALSTHLQRRLDSVYRRNNHGDEFYVLSPETDADGLIDQYTAAREQAMTDLSHMAVGDEHVDLTNTVGADIRMGAVSLTGNELLALDCHAEDVATLADQAVIEAKYTGVPLIVWTYDDVKQR